MADNTTLNTGSGGDVIASDDITGVKHQRVKISLGADGSATDALGGAGAVAAGVQRVTLASDDPAVALLTTIDADTGNLAGILTAVQTLDNAIAGNEMQVDIVGGGIAGATHDSAAASEGVQAMVEARSSDGTAVASGDAVRALATLLGKQVVLPFALPGSTWSYASAAAVTDTADDEAKAAGGAGVRHYITGVQVFNADDTVGTEVVIKDGSAVLWRGWAEQTGGGCSATFNPPLRGTAATAVNVANITTSAETYFNLQGFSASE